MASYGSGLPVVVSTVNVQGNTGGVVEANVVGELRVGNQTATLASGMAGYITALVNQATTDTTQNVAAVAAYLNINNGASSARTYRGLNIIAETLAANAQNLTAATGIAGIQCFPAHNGTGQVTGIRSINTGVTMTSTGGVTNARGFAVGHSITGGGVMTNGIGCEVAHAVSGAGSAMTNVWGMRYFNASVTGGATASTRQTALAIDALSGATHNSSIVIGQTAVPDGTYAIYSISTADTRLDGKIDLSNIAAGSPGLKIAATSDTPTVAFTDDGTAAKAPTTAPAGYLEILVGSDARYIPFWA